MGKAPTNVRSSTTESAVSNQQRPVSRASTTSVQTLNEESAEHPHHVSETGPTAYDFSNTQYNPKHTPEEIIGYSREHLIDPHRQGSIDPSVHVPATQHGKQVHSAMGQFDGAQSSRPSQEPHMFFQDKEDTPFTAADIDQTQDDFVQADQQKKKGSGASIANDQELRRLYQENKHRSLGELADAVLAEERGPRSEKTKQIFAMIWLSSVCHKGSGSVMRNRVFAHYATRCGNERVPPLTPPSFGKLVRIIFPGIQTRRLGMRGESKYHYVDLEMDEEVPDKSHEEKSSSFPGVDDRSSLIRQRFLIPADTAVFPSTFSPSTSKPPALNRPNMDSHGCLYLNSTQSGLFRGPSAPNLVSRELRFTGQNEPMDSNDQAIELPSLREYLPPGTDLDSADALRALYRAHCIAVIDAFRYCKERVFYHAFTSLHGTLTVPVQKLLAHPDLAPWMRECDWIMYQKMIRYVSHLALQVMPVKVLETLRTISSRLGQHILNTSQNHPAHMRDARHGPAVIFSSLLDRLLRVNATAHAAANLLTDTNIRQQMWIDWATYVRPSTVVETCLPGAGYTRTLQILTNEIRELLGPLSLVVFQGMQPIFQETATIHSAHNQHHIEDDLDTEGILDRWNNFLLSLPSKFPNADARTVINCVGQVGSAALRDMTVADCRSFGTWWVTKTWIDEMLLWHAEKGGFLDQSHRSMEMRPLKRSAFVAGFDVEDESNLDSNNLHQSGHGSEFGRQSQLGSPQLELDLEDMPKDRSSRYQEGSARSGVSSQTNGFHQRPVMPHQHSSRTSVPQGEVRYSPTGMIIRNKNYAGHLPTQQTQYQNPSHNTDGANDSFQSKDTKPTLSTYVAKDSDHRNAPNTHDDSGIGLDLDLPPQQAGVTSIRLTDYGSFVGTGTSSDPADVVVC